jgi:hypothetical protein
MFVHPNSLAASSLEEKVLGEAPRHGRVRLRAHTLHSYKK